MKKLIRASLLVLALSCTAYAGEMPTPLAAGEMPFPVANTQTNTQEPTTGDAQGRTATQSMMTEVVLSLANSILALF